MKTFLEPLTPDEEKIYIEKMRLGDKKAKDILIERNLRLVAHVVKKYYDENRENQDLISIGIVGLIKAVNTYNPDKGNRLVTYAAKCIENELLMMLRAEKKRSKDVSLNEPIGTDKEGNTISLIDVVENDEMDTLEQIEKAENISLVQKYVAQSLNEREKEILILRYGLSNNDELTQKDVADLLGISQSYISRLEKKIIKKLRSQLNYDEVK